MRCHVNRIALVIAAKAVKLPLGKCNILISPQHGRVKPSTLHLHQLINQHIAMRTDFAFLFEPAPQ